jgi:hypothetical protein
LTGAVLTTGNAAYAPLATMSLSTLIALAAAMCIRAFDARA